ncbi:MAG: hypothetical protein AAFR17_12985 [Pseudomonadota bacterium]
MGSLPWIEVLFGLGALAFGWHQTRLMRQDRERREAEAAEKMRTEKQTEDAT